jgi:simple sugar transport system ATP-binding protein
MVHKELLAKTGSGTAILYVSEDLDELFLVCDRILVLRKGMVEDVVHVAAVDKGDIGLLMSRGKGQEEISLCQTAIPGTVSISSSSKPSIIPSRGI